MLLYSDLPSGFSTEIADLRPLDIRSTENPPALRGSNLTLHRYQCHSINKYNRYFHKMQVFF